MTNKLLFFFLNFFEVNYFDHKNIVLRILGAKISKNVIFQKGVHFNLSLVKNLSISENVKIGRNTLIKIRENGILNINDNCTIEEDCRIISARDGTLTLKNNCYIGSSSFILSGGQLEIGSNVMVSSFCYISSSKRQLKKKIDLVDQEYDHGKIVIENDVLIGRLSTIMPNSIIKKGSVIGANSYVKIETEEYGIYAGSPIKFIKFRE
tara:strand:- start:3079 stop:3702 length:624 start_codon:yes stop_codon:yes gene_type:complete